MPSLLLCVLRLLECMHPPKPSQPFSSPPPPLQNHGVQVLCEELPALLASISFRKSMRWRSEATYSRPLRWLLALHGQIVLPFAYAGLRAGGATRLLRNGKQPEAAVPSADDYMPTLQASTGGAVWPEGHMGPLRRRSCPIQSATGCCVWSRFRPALAGGSMLTR